MRRGEGLSSKAQKQTHSNHTEITKRSQISLRNQARSLLFRLRKSAFELARMAHLSPRFARI
jgi:hypothetical protein